MDKQLTPPIIKRMRWALKFKQTPSKNNHYRSSPGKSYALDHETRIALAVLTLQSYSNDVGIVRVDYNKNFKTYRICRDSYVTLMERGFIRVYEANTNEVKDSTEDSMREILKASIVFNVRVQFPVTDV